MHSKIYDVYVFVFLFLTSHSITIQQNNRCKLRIYKEIQVWGAMRRLENYHSSVTHLSYT